MTTQEISREITTPLANEGSAEDHSRILAMGATAMTTEVAGEPYIGPNIVLGQE